MYYDLQDRSLLLVVLSLLVCSTNAEQQTSVDELRIKKDDGGPELQIKSNVWQP